MRETLSISLPKPIKAQLDAASREDGLARSDLVRQAIQEYLFNRKLRALRARMVPQAQQAGVFTDEDVFERVS
jgi:metal-responsive CopG/Arc/MetJ family transcriptional regulator